MMDWFRGGAKADESDASDDLLKQGDKERDAGDLTAALHFYGKALAVAGSPDKRKAALLAQSRTYVLNGDLAEAEEAATRALDLGVCAPSLVRRGCARRKLGHFGAAYEDLRKAAQLDPQNREARDEIRRLHAAAQRRQKFEAEAQRDAEAEQLRALLPNDVVDAVIASCREPFYAEASVAPGLGYELNAAIARVRGSVLAITPPRRCPGVNLSTTGKAVRDGKAPFYVDVVVRGDRPYEAGVWFRLVYASAQGPPRIRQASLGRTIVVDDDADHHGRRAGLQFYALLASRSDEPFGLEAVVEGLRAALEDDGSDRWRHTASDHARRRRVIDAYRNEWPAHKIGLFAEIDEPSALAAAVSAPGPFCAPLLPRSALAPRLVEALEAGDLRRCVEEVCEGVYAFDLFSAEFTTALLAEVDYFYGSKLPAARPNSMNNYGIIVNDIGLEPLIVALQRLVLLPLARELFSSSDRGDPATGFDSTHAFVVKYRADEDSHLDVHTDDSDVTFNVCLGRDFEGCGLVFCGMIGAADHRCHKHTYHHKVGACVVHLGARRHGADHITAGERLNLVIWNHGLAWRESDGAMAHQMAYEKEGGPPDPRCVSYTHDRDYGSFKPYTAGIVDFKHRGWCPPQGAEYKEFRADK